MEIRGRKTPTFKIVKRPAKDHSTQKITQFTQILKIFWPHGRHCQSIGSSVFTTLVTTVNTLLSIDLSIQKHLVILYELSSFESI